MAWRWSASPPRTPSTTSPSSPPWPAKRPRWRRRRMTPAELAELADLAGAIEGSDDVVAANRRFHRALNLAARSPRLLTYLRQAVRVVPGNYFELFPEAEQRSKEEHAALLEAMTRAMRQPLASIAEAHVLSAGEALGGWLAARATQHRAGTPPA